MKRFTTFVLSILAAVLLLPAAAFASDEWTFNVFQPATTITGRAVQVEYKVVASDPSLQFTVDLFQNGAQVATQTVTNPYGASGSFAVTVPSAGDYEFMLVADDQDGRTVTESRSVTFVDAAQPTVTTVYQNAQTTSGSPSSSAGGVVGDTAASTTSGATLADTDSASSNNESSNTKDSQTSNNKDWLWLIPAVAVIGGVYFLNKRRQSS